MGNYLNDPREKCIIPESGITLESDNRFETMYHWGAKVIDLCDLPVDEYMAPMKVSVVKNNGGGGGEQPQPEEHEYVDLGLPSGNLWATDNIRDENRSTLLFAWGEISGDTSTQVGVDKNFSLSDYRFYSIGGFTKDNENDGLISLSAEDDAARAYWGSKWSTPSKTDFEELFDVCSVELSGSTLLISKNGNVLEFNMGGMHAFDGSMKKNSIYFSSDLGNSVDTVYSLLNPIKGQVGIYSTDRINGGFIRPIINRKSYF